METSAHSSRLAATQLCAFSFSQRIGRFTVIDNESSAAATTPAEGPGPQQVAPDSHRVTDTHPSQPAAHAPSRLSKEAGPHATTPTSSAGLPMPTAVRKEALTHAPSDVSEAGTTLPLGTPPKAPKEGEKKKKKEGKRFAVVQDDATEKVVSAALCWAAVWSRARAQLQRDRRVGERSPCDAFCALWAPVRSKARAP